MVIRVCVSSLLCRFTDGQTEISLTVEGRTIKSMLKVLWKKYPNLQQQLKSSDGHLSNMVQIFVNRRNISVLQGLESNITDHDTVNISLLSDDLSVLPELNPQEMLRYSRHLSLPEIQEEGQRKLKAARVLIVGAGGLGCPASLYLAAAGVGIIGLIDDDVVDNSNLQRQILYSVDSIGVSKVEEAKSRLSSLNPHIQIFTYKEKFTVENALEIVREYDLVIDGTDNFATRYLVNDACVMLSKPYFYGSIFRFDGQASVFNYQGGPCYRCIFPDPPEPDMVPSCSEGGVLGVLPSIIGSIQATEAIKVITEAGVTLAGRLLLYDALNLKFHEMKVKRNTECPVCGIHPTIKELKSYENQQTCSIENTTVCSEITVNELQEKIESKDSFILLDVREDFERKIANLESSIHVPLGQLNQRYDELNIEQEIVVYCKTDIRSGQACEFLSKQGFQNVKNLRGGILAWASEIDSSIPMY